MMILPVEQFRAITLKEMEEDTRMLSRLDNKYILTKPLDEVSTQSFTDAFDILEIDGNRSFRYENVYFDAHERCFREHVQGKRLKFKARTRRYLDGKSAYFEVKLSGKKGQTDKFRLPCSTHEHGVFTNRFKKFLRERIREQYGMEFSSTLMPSVTTAYSRMTLVARDRSERLTVDYDMSFSVDGLPVPMPHNVTIIETKSKNGNGIADKILHAGAISAADRCSKFCIAMSLSGRVENYNQFLPVLKKYFNAPAPSEKVFQA